MTYVPNKNDLVELLKNKDECDDELAEQFKVYDWVKSHKQ